jgi:hypothetical protein
MTTTVARIDPERFTHIDAVLAASIEELLAAHEAATEIWSSCGGHALAARMDRVRTLTRTELHDRDVPCPECIIEFHHPTGA